MKEKNKLVILMVSIWKQVCLISAILYQHLVKTTFAAIVAANPLLYCK